MVRLGEPKKQRDMTEQLARFIICNPRNVHHVKKVLSPLCFILSDNAWRITLQFFLGSCQQSRIPRRCFGARWVACQ